MITVVSRPFKTRFDRTPQVKVLCSQEEKKTKSEFADECDINLIMARYRKTGILPQSALSAAARFGDFSQVPSFMEMQEKIIAAHELFEALPAAVRKQFDNDPGQFLEAAETKEGRDLLVKLGLGNEASQPLGERSPSAGGQPAAPAAQTPPAASKAASVVKGDADV
ncbi:VP3 [Kummerowia striata gokushovirus]|nr:VP3 [Kummerowia striata gokushovirus]